jgi:hypothetical protein
MGLMNAAASRKLPLLRFDDLREQEICKTWHSLNRWIDERGFPPGRMIGRFRMWTVGEVMDWVAAQPSCKTQLRGVAKRLALRSIGVRVEIARGDGEGA